MAAANCVYAVVGNIPRGLRAADLRNQFSQFTESGGFSCFHYRHRPEWRRPRSGPTPVPEPGRSPTCCCVVWLPADRAASFLLMYDGCQWMDRAGDSLRSRCFIRIVRAAEIADSNLFSYKTRKELRSQRAPSETFTPKDLSRLPELNPPTLMPNGNVGTPLRVFLELIQACRLPPRIITKLGLKFPKTSSSRRYGNVPFQYQGSAPVHKEGAVYKAAGGKISQGYTPAPLLQPGKEQQGSGQRKSLKREEEEGEESHSDDDDDTCEEWERHEALYEDVTTQERTKERLYEEEIELKWEKGGSGLVFYTDAQYWQEEKGDFDEETADDWDVDMSVYYDKDGGDKDSRDYVQMRLEQRQRDSVESVSVQSPCIGGFERYTKGIGRKVMEKQGWKDGQGLGSSSSGLADALENDGQNPKCKRGFGYHGEKIQNFQPRRQTMHLISTVYDQPEEMDQGDTLLRRQPVISMKYREDVKFVKGSELRNHTQ
ncbi:G patch domain-containing protein 3 [Heterodontus francisci]|uniref:G patch domain-containing protein 3 n=1 Tax=Heterodontus francisci TaxID=7792 RepID=UPI00355C65AD